LPVNALREAVPEAAHGLRHLIDKHLILILATLAIALLIVVLLIFICSQAVCVNTVLLFCIHGPLPRPKIERDDRQRAFETIRKCPRRTKPLPRTADCQGKLRKSATGSSNTKAVLGVFRVKGRAIHTVAHASLPPTPYTRSPSFQV